VLAKEIGEVGEVGQMTQSWTARNEERGFTLRATHTGLAKKSGKWEPASTGGFG
jgi:hypothetical protein